MSPVFKSKYLLTGAGTVSWPFEDILDSKWAICLSLHLAGFPYFSGKVRRSQRSHNALAEAVDLPLAGECHERHLPALTRLEPHRGAGRNVEPHAAGLRAVELQRRIGLEEMIMRADLDRPVPGIGDGELHAGPAGVELDLAVLGDDFAGDHGVPLKRPGSRRQELQPSPRLCAQAPAVWRQVTSARSDTHQMQKARRDHEARELGRCRAPLGAM